MRDSLNLFIFSLLFFFSGKFLTVAGYFPPTFSNSAARLNNRARKNKQTTEFLHAHNVARAASGASSMYWDKGLAQFASNWAKQRKTDCKMIHSSGPHGENLLWYKRNENWSPAKVVAKWVEEKFNYDPMTNTCKPGEMCGHYTQIVWRATTAVGCARAKCENDRGFLVVCEYSPCGNYEGESPFDLSN